MCTRSRLRSQVGDEPFEPFEPLNLEHPEAFRGHVLLILRRLLTEVRSCTSNTIRNCSPFLIRDTGLDTLIKSASHKSTIHDLVTTLLLQAPRYIHCVLNINYVHGKYTYA